MRLRVNLMPWREQRRVRDLRRFQVALIVAALMALLVVMLLDQLARSRLARQAEALAAHQAEAQRLDAVMAQIEQLRESRVSMLEQHAALAGLRARQGALPRLFLELELAMPEGARLTALRVRDGQVQLSGQAASPAVVARLMRELQASGVLHALELVHLHNLQASDEFQLAGRLAVTGS
ncbi:PilN domain-containing protein [Pseudomonas sp. UFMG81]|uniref:PilN domain-containing protein n=1 Tax=Pseudomonas sp. UFMG81 TaxID=2745936 RepID=UPI00189043F3|nr:PilN domain-containing protein [Pseudomonas sp. UFMG81]